MKFFSYGKQWIDKEDIQAVVKTLRSDFLTQGPKIKEFEERICEYTGAKYCVVVSNGTAALQLAVASLRIEKHREGITSPNTFVASSNCMIYNRVKPIFADIDDRTYCIDPEKIKEKITGNTSLIIPVHFAGQPCDMEGIKKATEKHGVYIIEDAAHAIGSKYADGSKVGNCKYSDLTIFSFHPMKTITSGEGGAITTNNKELYDRLLLLRNHGITKDRSRFNLQHSKSGEPWYHEMQILGFNYRLSDIHSSLGISQLKKLDKFIKRRREIVKKYNEAFISVDWLAIPYEKPGVYSAFHLYVLQIDFDKIGKPRRQVMEELKSRNIGTQVHYIPVHTQPYYQENYGYKRGDCPIAEDYYEKALSIPLYPRMINDDVDYVIKSIVELKNETNFNKYICLEKIRYSFGEYSIIPIRKTDMELIRQWRNEQIEILRQKMPITMREQRKYFKEFIKPLFNEKKPDQILFSYLLNEELIGYGGLTNIDWESKRAEVSFILDTKRTIDESLYRKEFSGFFKLIRQIAFKCLFFHRLYIEIFDIRLFRIFLFEEEGFVLEGRLKDHALINKTYYDSLIYGLIN